MSVETPLANAQRLMREIGHTLQRSYGKLERFKTQQFNKRTLPLGIDKIEDDMPIWRPRQRDSRIFTKKMTTRLSDEDLQAAAEKVRDRIVAIVTSRKRIDWSNVFTIERGAHPSVLKTRHPASVYAKRQPE